MIEGSGNQFLLVTDIGNGAQDSVVQLINLSLKRYSGLVGNSVLGSKSARIIIVLWQSAEMDWWWTILY